MLSSLNQNISCVLLNGKGKWKLLETVLLVYAATFNLIVDIGEPFALKSSVGIFRKKKIKKATRKKPFFILCIYSIQYTRIFLGGGFNYFVISPRKLGKMNPFWLIFFKGVGYWFNHQPDFYVKTTLPQVSWPFALGASAAACCACGNPCGFPTGGNPYGTAGRDQTFGGDSTSCRNQTWGKSTEGCQICINQKWGRCLCLCLMYQV